jgi:shikimate dehydrogenase
VTPARWRPGPATHLVGVIGWPVRHSLSPAIHNAAFRALDLDWAYVAFEVPPGGAKGAVDAVRALGLAGLNVTMPHKADVAAAVDRLSPAADVLGAVNTVHRRREDLVGDNTDGAGFLDAIRLDEGFDPAGRRCLVVGAGGAARAVVKALADAGAAEVIVVNRTPERAASAAALAGATGRVGAAADAGQADLVVNATPIGMPGTDEPTPIDVHQGGPDLPVDPAHLGRGQLVVDLVYHPAVTPLVDAARHAGAVAVNGLGMLIHQAAHAFRLWTGEDPPLEVMSAAALAELAARNESSGTPGNLPKRD